MIDYDKCWIDMPVEMRQRAVAAVKEALDEETVELIRRKHAEHGHDWIHHLIDLDPETAEKGVKVGMLREGYTTMSAHHGWGTGIRNLLRTEAGIRDEDLPGVEWTHVVLEDGTHPIEHNWDDHYTNVVEAAVGIRDA